MTEIASRVSTKSRLSEKGRIVRDRLQILMNGYPFGLQ